LEEAVADWPATADGCSSVELKHFAMDNFGDLLERLRATSPSKASKFLSFAGRTLSTDETEQLAEALRGKSCVTGLRLQGEDHLPLLPTNLAQPRGQGIVAGWRRPILKPLCCAGCRLEDVQARVVAKALTTNTFLETLELAGGSRPGLQARQGRVQGCPPARVVRSRCTTTCSAQGPALPLLHCRSRADNGISGEGAQCFVEAMQFQNTVLKVLDLAGGRGWPTSWATAAGPAALARAQLRSGTRNWLRPT
jgi:hypothetical protein